MAVMKAYQREYINKLVKPERKEYALTLKNIGTIDQNTILEEAADHSRLDVDTLRHALNALNEITSTSQDVLENVWKNFCIGK